MQFAIRVEFFGDEIDRITEFDPLTGEHKNVVRHVAIFPASHYIVGPRKDESRPCQDSPSRWTQQVKKFTEEGKLLEAQRIQQRTNYDIEMLQEVGMCKGIENYSAVLVGPRPAAPRPPRCWIISRMISCLMVDESHVTLPQIRGMYGGDYSAQEDAGGIRLPPAICL